MIIEDLRNIFAHCRDELIEVSQEFIYYAEEKVEEGRDCLFLLEYNRKTKRERILSNYILQNPSFVYHYYGFPNDIVVVMENGDSEVWVLRVDKATGEERNLDRIRLVGAFGGCAALNGSHLVFFTGENQRHKLLLRRYQEATGLERVVFLYDLDEKKSWYVRDPRVCGGEASGLLPFSRKGQPWLLLLRPHGDEEEKETCYKNRRWLGDHVCDTIWECPLLDWIVSVKAGESHTPLAPVFSAETAGMVRYAGKDRDRLYFRARYFPTNDQRILSLDMETGKKAVAADLNLEEGEPSANFLLCAGETQPFRIYRITEQEDAWRVQGAASSQMDHCYSKELGDLEACIDDRFLLARYILADQEVSYEFHSVVDTKTGKQQSYEGRCAVWEDTMILY